ncbi:MAG TPA: leucine zipper domain-containing protein [Candidatus Nitrosocosmicus sp.]
MPLGDVSPEQLNNLYKKEKDSDVKERILLVRRVRIDGQKEACKVAERELHKSRWWAYKWLNRFDTHGLDGLKDHPRSGRPPLIPQRKDGKNKTRGICKPIGLASQTSNEYYL